MSEAAHHQGNDGNAPHERPVLHRQDVGDDDQLHDDSEHQAGNNFDRSLLVKFLHRQIVVRQHISNHVVNQLHAIPNFHKIVPHNYRLHGRREVSQRHDSKLEHVVEACDVVIIGNERLASKNYQTDDDGHLQQRPSHQNYVDDFEAFLRFSVVLNFHRAEAADRENTQKCIVHNLPVDVQLEKHFQPFRSDRTLVNEVLKKKSTQFGFKS